METINQKLKPFISDTCFILHKNNEVVTKKLNFALLILGFDYSGFVREETESYLKGLIQILVYHVPNYFLIRSAVHLDMKGSRQVDRPTHTQELL